MAEEALRAKADYLSRLSHELYTPMNAIVNMAHIAAATEDMVKIKSCIASISDSGSRLLGMIDDIMDMSRIELGQISLVNLPFELERALIKAFDTVRQNADEKKLVLSYNIAKGVPTKLRGDELRFSQVITNLLKSVIRFTPDMGEIKLNIKTAGNVSGKADFQFRIESNGAERRSGETGLEMTISKALIEMMGGSIWTEEIKGGGSAVNFAVPLDIFG